MHMQVDQASASFVGFRLNHMERRAAEGGSLVHCAAWALKPATSTGKDTMATCKEGNRSVVLIALGQRDAFAWSLLFLCVLSLPYAGLGWLAPQFPSFQRRVRHRRLELLISRPLQGLHLSVHQVHQKPWLCCILPLWLSADCPLVDELMGFLLPVSAATL